MGFASSATLVDEMAGTTEVIVELSSASEVTVGVAYAVVERSARRDEDFSASDGVLTFGVGETSKSIPVTIVDDGVEEGDETFEIALAAPSNAALATATHTVTISARTLPRVAFSQASTSANEPVNAMVEVVLSEASNRVVTVDLEVAGTASGADHMLAAQTITFMPGETTKAIAIDLVDDALDEDDETVLVTLANPQGAALGATPQFAHTIIDDDAPPTVDFAAAAQSVGEDAGTLPVTVALSAPSGKPITVPFTLAGSASSPVDFTVATASPLMFAPGITMQTIDVTIVDDMDSEPAEIARLVLGVPTNATLGSPSQHQITITDNDAVCYGAGAYRVCTSPTPTGTVALPATLDTDTSSLCAAEQPTGWDTQGQPAACFVFGGTIEVASTAVTGSRPLVLVATTRIEIAGVLDVASHRGGSRGPGFAARACGAFTPATLSTDMLGGDGGAGGSFLTRGGDGGGGNNAPNGGVSPVASSPPTRLTAGCDGQNGGAGTGVAGAGGRGGGVVYLLSGGAIEITGAVNASGAGGSNGGNFAGGGGGGSGGMIKLSAPTIQVTNAELIANGGGGSGGSDNNTPGVPGQDPDVATPLTPAPGGNGPSGVGGRGYADGNAAGNGGDSNKGGGGGGGGGGFIQSDRALTGARVSAGVIDTP